MDSDEKRSSSIDITVTRQSASRVIFKISIRANDNLASSILHFLDGSLESGVLRRSIVRGGRRVPTVKSLQLQGLRFFFQRRDHV